MGDCLVILGLTMIGQFLGIICLVFFLGFWKANPSLKLMLKALPEKTKDYNVIDVSFVVMVVVSMK